MNGKQHILKVFLISENEGLRGQLTFWLALVCKAEKLMIAEVWIS